MILDDLAGYSRVLIAGGPRTGKTTLAEALAAVTGAPVRSTDDLISSHDWSGASLAVSEWMDEPGPMIIEGVATLRALRKWLARNFNGHPGFALALLDRPMVSLSKGQETMTKGVWTVWADIEDECDRRGMIIIRGAVK